MKKHRDTRAGFRRLVAGGVLVFASTACAERAQNPYRPDPEAATETTVLVENTGIAAVAIYASDDPARLGTVMPGRSQCIDLRSPTSVQHLIARPVGGGQDTVSPRFEVRPGEGWEWRVGTNPAIDGLSLVPRSQCDGTS